MATWKELRKELLVRNTPDQECPSCTEMIKDSRWEESDLAEQSGSAADIAP